MKKYFILHPLDGLLNNDCSSLTHSFEKIAEIEANSLDDAYYKSQNDININYRMLNKRSTSVGDIIVDCEVGIIYMVEDVGFSILCNHEHIINNIQHDWNVDKVNESVYA